MARQIVQNGLKILSEVPVRLLRRALVVGAVMTAMVFPLAGSASAHPPCTDESSDVEVAHGDITVLGRTIHVCLAVDRTP